MDIAVDELNRDTWCVRLSGRFDLNGTNEIDQRFTALTATHARKVIVDISGVDFLASIGMRLLLSCAKANAQRGPLARPGPAMVSGQRGPMMP